MIFVILQQKLIASYLSNRKQYVSLGDISSSLQHIQLGVFQGSTLGPLSFYYTVMIFPMPLIASLDYLRMTHV